MSEAAPGNTVSGEPPRILIIEDHPEIAGLTAYQLTRLGYRVKTAVTGPEGLDSLYRDIPDLLILDRMLPGLSGDDILKALRQDPVMRRLPVLVLTAKRERAERIAGLEMGADDYLTKPFDTRELVLRVGAILRRVRQGGVGAPSGGRVHREGLVQVHVDAMRVKVGGEEVRVTPTEFRLLNVLLERRGRTQSREQLREVAWPRGSEPGSHTSRTVDMHIRRLRAKLGPAGTYIETVRVLDTASGGRDSRTPGWRRRRPEPQPSGAVRRLPQGRRVRVPLRAAVLLAGGGVALSAAGAGWMMTRHALSVSLAGAVQEHLGEAVLLGTEHLQVSQETRLDSLTASLALSTGYRVSVFDKDARLIADPDAGPPPVWRRRRRRPPHRGRAGA